MIPRQFPAPWTCQAQTWARNKKFYVLKLLKIWLKMKSTESSFKSSFNEIAASMWKSDIFLSQTSIAGKVMRQSESNTHGFVISLLIYLL